MDINECIYEEGPHDAEIVILVEQPDKTYGKTGHVLEEYKTKTLHDLLGRHKINIAKTKIISIFRDNVKGRNPIGPDNNINPLDLDLLIAAINKVENAKVIIAVGESALWATCAKKGIDKYHCTVLESRPMFKVKKVIPVYDFERRNKDYSLGFYWQVAFKKAYVEIKQGRDLIRTNRNFVVNPRPEQVDEFFKYCYEKPLNPIFVDIETSGDVINTFGIAVSPWTSIAIPTRIEDYKSKEDYDLIWKKIKHLCESDIPKVLQNFVFDMTYLQTYGVTLKNIIFDTMLAMKWLNPEFECGLANIARVYSHEPYWKDEGKDWKNPSNWTEHYTYNCKDTAIAYECYWALQREIKERDLIEAWESNFSKMIRPLTHIATNGICVDISKHMDAITRHELLIENIKKQLNEISMSKVNAPFNEKSPKQIKEIFKAFKIKMPVKNGVPSVGIDSLYKIFAKNPENKFVNKLIELNIIKDSKNKLTFKTNEDDKTFFGVHGHYDECGQVFIRKNIFGHGLELQKLFSFGRGFFKSSPGRSLVEISLKNPVYELIQYDSDERSSLSPFDACVNLSRNSSLKGAEAVEAIWKFELVCRLAPFSNNPKRLKKEFWKRKLNPIKVGEAECASLLSKYYSMFPRIKGWQYAIKEILYSYRELSNPLGKRRAFYGRINEDLIEEAIRWRVNSTIYDVINRLSIYATEKYRLLYQDHEMILIECENDKVPECINDFKNVDAWHPNMKINKNDFRFSVTIKTGANWGHLTEV